MQDLNIQIFTLINSFNSPHADAAFHVITQFGNGLILIPLIAVLYRLERKLILPALLAFLISGAAVQIIKPLWSIPRPAAILENVHIVGEILTGSSFPSGHAATAMALFYVLAHGKRHPLKIIFLMSALLVGYSRIYVGAHFPADVLGGIFLGLTGGIVALKYEGFFMKYKKELFVLIVLPFLLLFYKLGVFPFFIVDEARNAEAAREMLERGDLIIPTYNYELRTDKPPLHYWFFIVFYKIFGVSEFSARFISPILGMGVVYITYLFTVRFIDKQTALRTAIILATSVYFVLLFRMAVPDPFLVFFSTAALLSFFVYFTSGTPKYIYLFYACMGLAVLSKGPIGFIMPLGIAVVFTFLHNLIIQQNKFAGSVKALRVFFSGSHIAGYAMAAAISIPWFVAVSIKTGGNFLSGFLFNHNIKRFFSHVAGPDSPFFMTFIFLVIGFFPWSFYLIQLIKCSLKDKKDTLTLFLITWFLCHGIFYTVSATRLPHYLVPAYPALAILTAKYFSGLPGKKASATAVAALGLLLTLLPVVIGGSAEPLLKSLAALFSDDSISAAGDILSKTTYEFMPWIALIWLPFAVAGVAAALSKKHAFLFMAAASAVFFLLATAYIIPLSKKYFIPGKVARVIHKYEKSGQTITGPIYAYGYYDPAFEFYIRKKIIKIKNPLDLKEGAVVVTAKGIIPESIYSVRELGAFDDILRGKNVRVLEITARGDSQI